MSDQPLPAEIWNHLKRAAVKLAVDDYAAGSNELWLAGRAAAVIAARCRNWPSDTDDDLYAAMKRIDREYGDGRDIIAAYNGAEIYRDNAEYGFLEKDDVIAFQVGLHRYIDRMLALRSSNEDGD